MHAVIDKAIAAGAAVHRVRAGTAVHRVVAVASVQRVVAASAGEDIVAARSGIGYADARSIASAVSKTGEVLVAEQAVVATCPTQIVIAGIAIQRISVLV